ncbi:MAG: polyprenol monophosphomannose synthase [Acidimicrobiales bacterium]
MTDAELFDGADIGADSGRPAGRPARYDRRRATARAVSIIVPTYNEAENLPVLLECVAVVMADFDYEVIVVDDDSPDRTWRIAEDLAGVDPRIRVVRRLHRRGLSSAVLDGMSVADGRVLAVIDADLQHDEAVLPDLVSPLLDGEADLVLGTRATGGGSYGAFGPGRRVVSWGATQLARQLLGVTASDPMSGFFAISRERFAEVGPAVNPRGFKILLEFLARGSRPVVAEVGYTFRNRTQGETKLSPRVMVAFLLAVVDLVTTSAGMLGFRRYGAVALTGLCLRLSFGSILGLTTAPTAARVAAVELAILVEFALHERFSVAPRPGPRPPRLLPLMAFHLVALHGILAIDGLGVVIATLLADISGPGELVIAVVMATVGVMITITMAFVVAATAIWPGRMARRTLEDGPTWPSATGSGAVDGVVPPVSSGR